MAHVSDGCLVLGCLSLTIIGSVLCLRYFVLFSGFFGLIFCFVGYVTVYYGISVFVGGLFRSSPSPGVLSVTLVGGGHMTYSTVLYISMSEGGAYSCLEGSL